MKENIFFVHDGVLDLSISFVRRISTLKLRRRCWEQSRRRVSQNVPFRGVCIYECFYFVDTLPHTAIWVLRQSSLRSMQQVEEGKWILVMSNGTYFGSFAFDSVQYCFGKWTRVDLALSYQNWSLKTAPVPFVRIGATGSCIWEVPLLYPTTKYDTSWLTSLLGYER